MQFVRLWFDMRVSDVLEMKGSQSVLTVKPSSTLRQVVKMLCDMNIGALVVRESEERIDGIISERDILHQCGEAADFDKRLVSEAMTRDVITIEPEKDMKVAMELMCTARVRHLPVVDGGQIHGIVTIGDVVKAMRESDSAKFVSFLERFAEKEELAACGKA